MDEKSSQIVANIAVISILFDLVLVGNLPWLGCV